MSVRRAKQMPAGEYRVSYKCLEIISSWAAPVFSSFFVSSLFLFLSLFLPSFLSSPPTRFGDSCFIGQMDQEQSSFWLGARPTPVVDASSLILLFSFSLVCLLALQYSDTVCVCVSLFLLLFSTVQKHRRERDAGSAVAQYAEWRTSSTFCLLSFSDDDLFSFLLGNC